MASMLMQGEGVQQDDREGVRLLRLSADQGLPVAQFGLGQCHEYGRGVVVDLVRARACKP
jgi:TPR repeat protein